MPICKRCLAENRSCVYVKSRRGIRDAKERSLIADNSPAQHMISEPLYILDNDGAAGPRAMSSDASPSSTSDEDPFVAAYYAYFHPAHSTMLPKHRFLEYLEHDPEPMQFLISAVKFVGSLYLPRVPAVALRQAAFSAACGPLPVTPQSVSGLLILSIAALGETEFGYQSGWTERAISMALEIGMQHKTFAGATSDPILAESHRRTYWGLYLLDSLRAGCEPGHKPLLPGPVGDVDLPCEEWEYDSRQIPTPTSLVDYDRQNDLESIEFSSWAYLIDICRIMRTLNVPYQDTLDEKKVERLDRVDALIQDWLVRVPQWKKDLEDSDGFPDMILSHAIALAQQNRLRIYQCTSRQGLDLRQIFSLGVGPGLSRQVQNVKTPGWSDSPVDIHAANSVCNLFQSSFPLENLSPLVVPGLFLVAVAYLDACIFRGFDTPTYMGKIQLLLQLMTAHGGIWPISRKIADEIREVASDYSIPPESLGRDSESKTWTPDSLSSVILNGVTTAVQSQDSGWLSLGDVKDWGSDFRRSLT
ncbi:hypothetical protein TruAng_000893 [Truncatella angustata]|nr:hypothetical protein TruAng_000893 [Truncatella angustata]